MPAPMMTDPLTAAGSMLRIVASGVQLATTLQTYMELVGDAEHELHDIVFDVNATAAAIKQLHAIIDADRDAPDPAAAVFKDDGVREVEALAVKCHAIYKNVITLIQRASSSSSGSGPADATLDLETLRPLTLMSKLAWPWLRPRILRCQKQLNWLKVSLLFTLQMANIAQWQMSGKRHADAMHAIELRDMAEQLQRQRNSRLEGMKTAEIEEDTIGLPASPRAAAASFSAAVATAEHSSSRSVSVASNTEEKKRDCAISTSQSADTPPAMIKTENSFASTQMSSITAYSFMATQEPSSSKKFQASETRQNAHLVASIMSAPIPRTRAIIEAQEKRGENNTLFNEPATGLASNSQIKPPATVSEGFPSYLSHWADRVFGRQKKYLHDGPSSSLAAYVAENGGLDTPIKVPFGHERLLYGLEKVLKDWRGDPWSNYMALSPAQRLGLDAVTATVGRRTSLYEQTCLAFKEYTTRDRPAPFLLVFFSLTAAKAPITLVLDGRRYSFPFATCQTSQDLEQCIDKVCTNASVSASLQKYIDRRCYELMDQNRSVILRAFWADFIKPGAELHVLLEDEIGDGSDEGDYDMEVFDDEVYYDEGGFFEGDDDDVATFFEGRYDVGGEFAGRAGHSDTLEFRPAEDPLEISPLTALEGERVFITGTPEESGRVDSHPKRITPTKKQNPKSTQPNREPSVAWGDLPHYSIGVLRRSTVFEHEDSMGPEAAATDLNYRNSSPHLVNVLRERQSEYADFSGSESYNQPLASPGLRRHPTNAPLPNRPGESLTWNSTASDRNSGEARITTDSILEEIENTFGETTIPSGRPRPAPIDGRTAEDQARMFRQFNSNPATPGYPDERRASNQSYGNGTTDDDEADAGAIALQQANANMGGEQPHYQDGAYGYADMPAMPDDKNLPPHPEEQDFSSDDSEFAGVDLAGLSGGYGGMTFGAGPDVPPPPGSSSSQRPLPTPTYFGNLRTGYHEAPASVADRIATSVDYFSYQWGEQEIWRTWRYVLAHQEEIPNSWRLENVLWRTWIKERCRLGTVSAQALPWEKDSDVTWLYGPVVEQADNAQCITIRRSASVPRGLRLVKYRNSPLHRLSSVDLSTRPESHNSDSIASWCPQIPETFAPPADPSSGTTDTEEIPDFSHMESQQPIVKSALGTKSNIRAKEPAKSSRSNGAVNFTVPLFAHERLGAYTLSDGNDDGNDMTSQLQREISPRTVGDAPVDLIDLTLESFPCDKASILRTLRRIQSSLGEQPVAAETNRSSRDDGSSVGADPWSGTIDKAEIPDLSSMAGDAALDADEDLDLDVVDIGVELQKGQMSLDSWLDQMTNVATVDVQRRDYLEDQSMRASGGERVEVDILR